MPAAGRKPKPAGQAVNRNKPTYEWTEVEAVPYTDGPDLPDRPGLNPLTGELLEWPDMTLAWWADVSTMPHCKLWTRSDWRFAFDTALVAASFHEGDLKAATELRNREKVLGTTADYRRDLRIRYVEPREEERPRLAEVKTLDFESL